ncbi:hypothetical protein IC582_027741 [Cucumis melo]
MRVILPPLEMYENFQLLSFFWIFSTMLSQNFREGGFPPKGTPSKKSTQVIHG